MLLMTNFDVNSKYLYGMRQGGWPVGDHDYDLITRAACLDRDQGPGGQGRQPASEPELRQSFDQLEP